MRSIDSVGARMFVPCSLPEETRKLFAHSLLRILFGISQEMFTNGFCKIILMELFFVQYKSPLYRSTFHNDCENLKCRHIVRELCLDCCCVLSRIQDLRCNSDSICVFLKSISGRNLQITLARKPWIGLCVSSSTDQENSKFISRSEFTVSSIDRNKVLVPVGLRKCTGFFRLRRFPTHSQIAEKILHCQRVPAKSRVTLRNQG